MKKLLLSLTLLCCTSGALAKTTLLARISFEETRADQAPYKRDARTSFDITDCKKGSYIVAEDMTCTWEIVHETEKTITVSALVHRHENGESVTLAKPLLVMNWDSEGKIVLGERIRSDKNPEIQRRLEIAFTVSKNTSEQTK